MTTTPTLPLPLAETEEARIFCATVAGEALGCSVAAQKAVASVILNRVGRREWSRWKTPLQVIAMSGFDAFEHENAPYVQALQMLRKYPDGGMGALLRLVAAVMPLYQGLEAPIPGIVLYYSPKALRALHEKNPKVWRSPVPGWRFEQLEPVDVPGAERDDFMWFKYRRGA
jgi:hypothetical protein